MEYIETQISQLEQGVAAQEALRPTLGDAIVDAMVSTLRNRIESLRKPEPTVDDRSSTILSPALLSGDTAAGPASDRPGAWARPIPDELADKMRASRHVEGARKQVTVMFADLSGFTALGERLDAEVLSQLTNDVLKDLSEAVYEHEGYIDKYIGDAIMAVFGAPVSHEDDPERALHTALAMRERLHALNRRFASLLPEPLDLHIGISTGTVIADTVGSERQLSYTVMGDTVNTASRLEGIAKSDQILVSRETYRATNHAFIFTSLEPVMVKGKSQPVAVFELERARLAPSHKVGVSGLAKVFVGRNSELDALQESAQQLPDGHGRIIRITGEAGVGKSRLIAEFRASLDRLPLNGAAAVRFLEGRCFSHTSALSYGPFLDLLRRLAQISDDDSEFHAQRSFDQLIHKYFQDDLSASAVLRNLMTLESTPEEKELLANWRSDQYRARLFDVMRSLFESLADEQPLYVLIEDVHWADGSSLELLARLIEVSRSKPLGILIVSRPTHAEGAQSGTVASLDAQLRALPPSHVLWFVLHTLSPSDSIQMLGSLLSTDSVPPELQEKILHKGEGNPFFIEEVLRSLIERGALVHDEVRGWITTSLLDTITVPDTLQGVLMSRLDRLPRETKWVVQQASVIGRIFLYRVLRQMAMSVIDRSSDGTLDSDITFLEREELIREKTRLPEIEYIFKHALTQETAYYSLLTPRRRELHRRAGEVMEKIFEGRIAEFYPILAHHFLRGEAWDKAERYYLAAGDAATRIYANAEARSHYSNALAALVPQAASVDKMRRHATLLIKYVGIAFLAEDPKQNLARVEEARELMETIHQSGEGIPSDRLLRVRISYFMGRVEYIGGKNRKAMEIIKAILPDAEACGDAELLTLSRMQIGRCLFYLGRFDQAAEMLSRDTSELSRVAGEYDQLVVLCFAGNALSATGKLQRALVLGEQSLATAIANGNRLATILSHLCLCVMQLLAGEHEAAYEHACAGRKIAEEAGERLFDWAGYQLTMWAAARAGKMDAALDCMAKGQELRKLLGSALFMADWFAAAEVEVLIRAGQWEEAEDYCLKNIEDATATDSLYAEGLNHFALGRISSHKEGGLGPNTVKQLSVAISCFEESQALCDLTRAHLVWANLASVEDERNHHIVQARKVIDSFDFSPSMLNFVGFPIDRSVLDAVVA